MSINIRNRITHAVVMDGNNVGHSIASHRQHQYANGRECMYIQTCGGELACVHVSE